jgi:hypothetical protein
MTLIHSSHDRKIESVTNSAKMIKSPESTDICVAIGSRSYRRAQGDMHSQIPSSQLHQSSHCFGSENSTAAIVASKHQGAPEAWHKKGGAEIAS